jgi:hypothetical protein
VLFQPEGSYWEDPPGYWDGIVWPAYLKAHVKMFQNDDVEHGEPLLRQVPVTREAALIEGPGSNPAVDGIESVESIQGDEDNIANGEDEQIRGVPVDRLHLFDAENMGMEGLFVAACECVLGETSVKRT